MGLALPFIVLGRRVKERTHGGAYPAACPTCKEQVTWELVKLTTYLHAFYINLIPTNKEYALRCPECHTVAELSKQQYDEAVELAKASQEVEAGVGDSERYYERLEEFEDAIEAAH